MFMTGAQRTLALKIFQTKWSAIHRDKQLLQTHFFQPPGGLRDHDRVVSKPARGSPCRGAAARTPVRSDRPGDPRPRRARPDHAGPRAGDRPRRVHDRGQPVDGRRRRGARGARLDPAGADHARVRADRAGTRRSRRSCLGLLLGLGMLVRRLLRRRGPKPQPAS